MTGGPSVGAALDRGARRLHAAGVPEARREARLLLAHAAGVGRETLIGWPERPLGAGARDSFDRLLARRAAREPMAHVLGYREFWSLRFRVGRHVFDPRPDSETLIEAALRRVDDRRAPLRLLDLGTGSGCLLLALLRELPAACGVGVDIDARAAAAARGNACALGLAARARFVVGDWDACVGGAFDLVVANPPYLPSGGIAALAPEVARFEPRGALDGGADGLAAYRVLAPAIARRLAVRGIAAVEIGAGQAPAAARIMAGAGLDRAGLRNDLAGVPRCLILRRRPPAPGYRGNRVARDAPAIRPGRGR